MILFIFQIILVLSLGGIVFLAVHKMPKLSELSPEVSSGNKQFLKTVFLEKSKRAGMVAGNVAKVSTQKGLQYSAHFASKITASVYKVARKPETTRITENSQERVERTSAIEQGHGYWQDLKDKSKVKAKRQRNKTTKKGI